MGLGADFPGCQLFSHFQSEHFPSATGKSKIFKTDLSHHIALEPPLKPAGRQKNLYCFFKCPQCGTVLRVPAREKRHIRITCKKDCGHVFERELLMFGYVAADQSPDG